MKSSEEIAEEVLEKYMDGLSMFSGLTDKDVLNLMQAHTNTTLSELEERVEGLHGDAMAPPQSAEAGYNNALMDVLQLITEMKADE